MTPVVYDSFFWKKTKQTKTTTGAIDIVLSRFGNSWKVPCFHTWKSITIQNILKSIVLNWDIPSTQTAHRLRDNPDICAHCSGDERDRTRARHPPSTPVHRHRLCPCYRRQREPLLRAQSQTHQAGWGHAGRVGAHHVRSPGSGPFHAADHQVHVMLMNKYVYIIKHCSRFTYSSFQSSNHMLGLNYIYLYLQFKL